jgi:hypothetical protein
LSGGTRLFWANWSDDQNSTHLVGFVYRVGKKELEDFGNKEEIVLENAIEYFNRQLENIPPRK